MDEKTKKQIREELLLTNPELVIGTELEEINEELDEISGVLSGIDFNAVDLIKGDKGDKGERGERGLTGERGERGLQGIQGLPGKDGIDGKDGRDGKDGKDGYTPIKGFDYFTDEDVNLISLDVQSQLAPMLEDLDIDKEAFEKDVSKKVEKRAIDILDKRTQFLINKKTSWGNITGSITDQTDLTNYISNQLATQDTLQEVTDNGATTTNDINTGLINGKDTDFIPVAAGTVQSNGTALKIKGATVARTSTGLYTITFDTAQPDANYVVTATILDDGGRTDKIYYINKTTTTFQIETAADDNSSTPDVLTDHGFDFVVHNW